MKKKRSKRISYKEESKRVAKERRIRPTIRKLVFFVKVMVLFAVIFGGHYVWKNNLINSSKKYFAERVIIATSFFGLNLDNIYLDGINYTSADKVLSAMPAELSSDNKDRDIVPIYSISLDDLKVRLENMGWIKSAMVERQLPDTLHIKIIERKPIAIWQYNRELNLIDINGEVISDISESGRQFSNLPILVGEDANLHANNLFSFLAIDSELLEEISSIIRIGGRRWNIRLKDGIEIQLPEENPHKAWQRLLELDKKERILDREIRSVDLRIEDRVFVSTIEDKK